MSYSQNENISRFCRSKGCWMNREWTYRALQKNKSTHLKRVYWKIRFIYPSWREYIPVYTDMYFVFNSTLQYVLVHTFRGTRRQFESIAVHTSKYQYYQYIRVHLGTYCQCLSTCSTRGGWEIIMQIWHWRQIYKCTDSIVYNFDLQSVFLQLPACWSAEAAAGKVQPALPLPALQHPSLPLQPRIVIPTDTAAA